MKKLEKLRLINWHLFTNTTTNIENITFLTGANGTGKSTIIDALQIIFLGDTTGNNFNKAASEKSSRTLMGYLRCETGKKANGEEICLRSGRFSSYIACQFYDDKTDKHFTVGIVFDVIDTEKSQSFFYINDKFPEHNFTNADLTDAQQIVRPLTIRELSDYCKRTYDKDDYKFFDTNLSYQQFIKELFGQLPTKYFNLFKKAVGFKPISNISQFITEFVCDVENKIDITSMQKNIENYKLLEIAAKKIQTQIEELTDIGQKYQEFTSLKNSLSSFTYINDRVDFERLNKTLNQIDDQIRANDNKIKNNDRIYENNLATIQDLQSQKEGYLAKKLQSSGYSLTEKLNTSKNQLTNTIVIYTRDYQDAYDSLQRYVDNYITPLTNFINKYANYDFSSVNASLHNSYIEFVSNCQQFLAHSKQIASYIASKCITEDTLLSYKEEMETLRNDGTNITSIIRNFISEKANEMNEIENSIATLSGGQKVFPQIYTQVKDDFERQLKDRYHDAKVQIYCDLVDITDKAWTRAIECAISPQRLNLFVNEKYYNEASKLLGRICENYNFYSIAIIDSEKIVKSNPPSNPDSVAKLIKTDHAGARAYTDFLLGRIKKCDTFEEAREAGFGLLANCTGYRNFSSWYLDKRKGDYTFLGTKIDEKTQFSYHQERNKLEKEVSILNDIAELIQNIVTNQVISDYEANSILEKIANFAKVEDLERRVESLDNQLHEGNLSDVSALDEQISNFEKDITDLQKQNEALLLEKGAAYNNIRNLREVEYPKIKDDLERVRYKLEHDYKKEDVDNIFEPEFQKICSEFGIDKLATEISKRNRQVAIKLQSARSQLLQARANYNTKYSVSYDVTNETSNEDFDKELLELSDVKLPDYQQKIQTAHSKAIKEFRDDFIYKLRNSITTVKSQIDDLNLALKDCHFGRDSYEFSVVPNRAFGDYYDMIMDDLLLKIGDAEDEYLEKYRDKMEELFNMISDTGATNRDEKEIIMKNIDKFTDYTTYLVFDLLVKKGDTGETTSLAYTFKSTSGGESQTPFYISILASFAQLYRVSQANNNDTIRLVIFDEAFSKMDAGRINQACLLLKQFGLQAILSTPSEKLRDLVNYVDLILVAIHDEKKGSRSYIDVYKDMTKPETKITSVFADLVNENKDENN